MSEIANANELKSRKQFYNVWCIATTEPLVVLCRTTFRLVVIAGPWIYRRQSTSRYWIARQRLEFEHAKASCEQHDSILNKYA